MKRVYAALFVSFALSGLLLPGQASALTFSPPSLDYTANAGDALDDAIKLRNETDVAVQVKATAVNFGAKPGDETSGTPDFYPAGEERDGRGMGAWITFPKNEMRLEPGERGNLFFHVLVPKDADPGSYFGAVMLETISDPTARQGVGVVGNTAVLFLLRVNGTAIEDLTLTSFEAQPALNGSLPARFQARVTNGGSVHLRPYGEVTIKNAFGKVVGTVPINRAEYKSVLPGMTRRYDAEWYRRAPQADAPLLARQWNDFALGPYTAELRFSYGTHSQTLTATARFWVIPWLALLVVIGGGAALILVLAGLLSVHRQRVIRQYERSQE